MVDPGPALDAGAWWPSHSQLQVGLQADTICTCQQEPRGRNPPLLHVMLASGEVAYHLCGLHRSASLAGPGTCQMARDPTFCVSHCELAL